MAAEEHTPETAMAYLDIKKPVGVPKKAGRYFGVACLNACAVSDRELHVNRFGLQFSKDASWEEPLLRKNQSTPDLRKKCHLSIRVQTDLTL
jgi:hypothetical protein